MFCSLVHRLDKATSGVCLVARNQGVQQRLHRLFHDGKVKKQYHAITIGVPYPPKGTITGFIGAAAANPQALVYSPTGADLGTSKVEATTKYRVIKHLDTTTGMLVLVR
jgi:23S rRNA-/tRNA-specific pseudouridylate synthase